MCAIREDGAAQPYGPRPLRPPSRYAGPIWTGCTAMPPLDRWLAFELYPDGSGVTAVRGVTR